ncbi:hypothetical protein ACTHHL_11200 [Aeribacillus composti]|jgi:RsiW-degrading membrane proteinase PrsW (M82 family)|uniref:hypothetical protein n=1 Tax=Aeribacillus TaxID=1055323 RepID=UPI00119BC370|nr:hypothetical protein [Aeribacillus composti]MDR9797773.1 hypothetical protein [Aeribacillus pallidus]MED0715314.1 hypothetical protein [Aeribacillus composti]TVZ82236.1 hypothetical protein FB379_114103 [Aeribacillus composti]BBU38506.1 hypothetical protein APP_07980 [Aeribacillus pallidus]
MLLYLLSLIIWILLFLELKKKEDINTKKIVVLLLAGIVITGFLVVSLYQNL